MTPVVDRLLARWRADPHAAPTLRPGATVEQLDAFERRHRVPLPLPLRDLYAATNGTETWFDGSMATLAPLDEVVPLREFRWNSAKDHWHDGLAWSDRWFVFADYLISSHLFMVRLDADPGNPGAVISWDGGLCRHLIAPSILAFLELWEGAHGVEFHPGFLHDHTESLPEEAP